MTDEGLGPRVVYYCSRGLGHPVGFRFGDGISARAWTWSLGGLFDGSSLGEVWIRLTNYFASRVLGPSRGWSSGLWVSDGAGVQGFGSQSGLEVRALGLSRGWRLGLWA